MIIWIWLWERGLGICQTILASWIGLNETTKKVENFRNIVSKHLDKNSHYLHLDKVKFLDLSHHIAMGCKQEDKFYITLYYIYFLNVIMYVYCAAKVDMTEDFRNELSQFMLGMRSTIAQDIQKRVGKYDMGK